MSNDGIRLATAVAAVRDELLAAAVDGIGNNLAFEVGDIQMEFTVELRTEGKTGLKVRAWVVEAGAEGALSRSQTHKVAFTLKPRNARTGGPWNVGNEDQGSTSHFGRGTGSQ